MGGWHDPLGPRCSRPIFREERMDPDGSTVKVSLQFSGQTLRLLCDAADEQGTTSGHSQLAPGRALPLDFSRRADLCL